MYLITTLLFTLIACFDAVTCDKNDDWDVIIFTQHWPVTVCYEWHEKQLQNTCTLPRAGTAWTVHGVWPTKRGTTGPYFCRHGGRLPPFRMQEIAPLEPQLMMLWTNVEHNTPPTALWKHEWLKHGTCANVTEVEYFQLGLDLLRNYTLPLILSAGGGIVPSNGRAYAVRDVHDAVAKVLGKRPVVECYADVRSGMLLLREIRLCFSKSLELVDCDGILSEGGGSCDMEKEVLYPVTVPEPPNKHDIPWQLNLYRILQFLIWFTI